GVLLALVLVVLTLQISDESVDLLVVQWRVDVLSVPATQHVSPLVRELALGENTKSEQALVPSALGEALLRQVLEAGRGVGEVPLRDRAAGRPSLPRAAYLDVL